jgi:acyl carrier protein phosphodiesterase
MNWLAHVFLSEQNIDFQVGNFLADPLKGKLWNDVSQDMINGVKMHQRIDSYTDSHQLFSASKSKLRVKGLLKGVVMDLTYDYLLTKNWHCFTSVTKIEFLKTFNENALKRSAAYPRQARELVENLVTEDRLNKYNNLGQLKKSFQRIDTRLSPRLLARETTESYFDEVCAAEETIEEDFLDFFPDLCRYTKSFLDASKFKHCLF